MVEGLVSPVVVGFLKGMTSAVERNDFNGAMNIHKELVKKTWDESKDWANALKVLISFKQRFAQWFTKTKSKGYFDLNAFVVWEF